MNQPATSTPDVASDPTKFRGWGYSRPGGVVFTRTVHAAPGDNR